jgi:DNA-binding response OmpR family regulator
MLHYRWRLRALHQFSPSLIVAGIELDRDAGLARRDGRYLRLGVLEVQLLDLFMSNPGVTFTREQLISQLWGAKARIERKTIDVKIGRLRKALTLGRAPDPILSVRGTGYKFSESSEQEFAKWTALGPPKLRLRPFPADSDEV